MTQKIISIFLWVAFLSTTSFSQDWKNYPYHEDETVITFPEDEGWHEGEAIEWWYTTAHLTGEETGNEYTVMLTYFYYDSLIFDGFRLLNIANETTGDFYSDMKVCTYPILAVDHLEIQASLFPGGGNESWVTAKDENGDLLPFEYNISAASNAGSIQLNYNTVKRPLIVGGTGLFNQGVINYTYYYSLTGIEASGTLTLGNITEAVSGTAWIDRQYGSFNPLTGEKYEWFSLQLSNGMDINLWNIFTVENEIPPLQEYQMFSAYVNEDSTFTTSDFNLKRLGYFITPDHQRSYAKKWQLTSEIHDIDLVITSINTNSELVQPFYFFEGGTSIEGTVDGMEVTGVGFAELLHMYNHPEIQIITPSDGWSADQPISWELTNPDEGCPVSYSIEVSFDNKVSYSTIAQNLTGTSFLWDPSGFPQEELYWFRITAYSIDSTLMGVTETSTSFPLTTGIDETPEDIFVKIYPNPAKEVIVLEWASETTGDFDIQLFNALGQTVKSTSIKKNLPHYEMKITDLEPGLFFIKISSKNMDLTKPVIILNHQ